MKLDLTGLIAAPHTPLSNDGSLNPEQVKRQAQWLERSGVVGAFIGGTTGEWCSLTTDERKELLTAWGQIDTGLARIAHVGHNAQRDAVDLARHAARHGADAISAVAPSFLKPGTPQAVADYFAPIAAAGDGLPFYIYHIPGLSGVNVPPHLQIAACAKAIPNFVGLKFTDPDLSAYARCQQRYGDQYELMWGVDEVLLSALPLGAKSAVGSTYNYAAPLFNEMIDAYRQNNHDQARQQSMRAVQLVDLLLEFGVLAAGKALMTLRGVDCGPTRSPVPTLAPDRREALYERILSAGLLDEVPESRAKHARTNTQAVPAK